MSGGVQETMKVNDPTDEVSGGAPNGQEVERRFRAMNTDVLAIVVAGAGAPDHAAAEAALDDVERQFATVEACASRFRPESELSALNQSAGRPFAASPLLFELVASALRVAGATGGAFDPTLLDALERAGYDRSFERLSRAGDAVPAPSPAPVHGQATPGSGWQGVGLDHVARTITLPPGCRIDLGGIGKGWTVDRACALLREWGFRYFAVDAGGDLYAAGVTGDGFPWTVGVSDPADPDRDIAVLTLDGQAVATSTTARRRWVAGGEVRHHLIDPRTRHPAASGVASATVVAETVARAETLAKAALVLGPEAGRVLLAQEGVAGLLTLDSGARVQVGPAMFAGAAPGDAA
jgi:thiamine biosynthesis lipoprotein